MGVNFMKIFKILVLACGSWVCRLPCGSISGLYKDACLIQPCITFLQGVSLNNHFTWLAHAYTDTDAACTSHYLHART